MRKTTPSTQPPRHTVGTVPRVVRHVSQPSGPSRHWRPCPGSRWRIDLPIRSALSGARHRAGSHAKRNPASGSC